MRQLTAFTKKEFLEQVRTGKLLILFILFCLFGIMNPAIAKLTPWMLELMSEQLAENGMVIQGMEVNALTSWVQFFKNIPMALIVFVVMFGGILTAEYQRGTLVNVITKGLKRWKILASKMFVMAVFWTAGYWMTFGITYGYNAYFWDNSIVANLFPAVGGYYLAGLWLITVILPASAVFNSGAAVTLSVGAVFMASYLLGFLPDVKKYVPTFLMSSNELMAGAADGRQYLAAAGIAVLLIVIHVISAVMIFDRRGI